MFFCPTPILLVIDNALDHGFYRPCDHWSSAAGRTLDSVHPPSGQALPDCDAYSHVILSGSEASILQRAEWAEEEARWIAEAAKASTRLLGSCWGHQLLAVALAGPQAVQRSESPEVGWLQIWPQGRDPLLPVDPFWCFSSHFDEVRPDAAAELRILPRSAGCSVGAMRWGEQAIWGIQAHPEVDVEAGKAFLEGGATRWKNHRELFEGALAHQPVDDGVASGLLQHFVAI